MDWSVFTKRYLLLERAGHFAAGACAKGLPGGEVDAVADTIKSEAKQVIQYLTNNMGIQVG